MIMQVARAVSVLEVHKVLGSEFMCVLTDICDCLPWWCCKFAITLHWGDLTFWSPSILATCICECIPLE